MASIRGSDFSFVTNEFSRGGLTLYLEATEERWRVFAGQLKTEERNWLLPGSPDHDCGEPYQLLQAVVRKIPTRLAEDLGRVYSAAGGSPEPGTSCLEDSKQELDLIFEDCLQKYGSEEFNFRDTVQRQEAKLRPPQLIEVLFGGTPLGIVRKEFGSSSARAREQEIAQRQLADFLSSLTELRRKNAECKRTS